MSEQGEFPLRDRATFGVQADIELRVSMGPEFIGGDQRINVSVSDMGSESPGVLALVRTSRGAVAAHGGQRIAAGLRALAASIEHW